jgi:hypothetical protein
MFKYLGYYVDERLSFNQHCKRMLQRIRKNSGILKYVARSKTSSARARKLIPNAFIQTYLQMIYAVMPMLSLSSIEKIEAKNQQLSRLIHHRWDATNDEVRWLPNYEKAESKAQRFLRRFIDKTATISPELFDDYILDKAMPMHIRIHIEGQALIDALPRGRFNHYVDDWIDDNATCIIYRPSSIKKTKNEIKHECERDVKAGLLVEFPIIMVLNLIKALTHTHLLRIIMQVLTTSFMESSNLCVIHVIDILNMPDESLQQGRNVV